MTKAVYNISQLLTDWSWELFLSKWLLRTLWNKKPSCL